jgi:hypothetical protein
MKGDNTMTKFYKVIINFVDKDKKDYHNNYMYLNEEQYETYKSIKKELTILNVKLLEKSLNKKLNLENTFPSLK